MRIHQQCYGKERVRLTHLDRTTTPHQLFVGVVDVTLEGNFEESYTKGDNRKVVATDSMKNTVYVLAREHGVRSLERFAILLARHFVESYEVVSSAIVDVEREQWQPIARLDPDSGELIEQPSALVRAGTEVHFASAQVSAVEGASLDIQLSSGLDALQVAKTADSGFSDFHRDRFATLQDTDDRIFATTIRAEWIAPVEEHPAEDHQRRRRVRSVLLDSFAKHHSLSVQQTLFAMATAVLEEIEGIEEITLQLPNQHHLLVDLKPFGLDNPNRVFVGTTEPFGNIEATVRR